MALAVTDLIKDLDRKEVSADMLAGLAAVGITDFAEGSPVLVVIDIFADQFVKKWNGVVAPWIRSKYLDYAAGDWLSLRAWTDWNRYRNSKTFASGAVTLENRGAGFYTIIAGDVRVKNGADKTFTNTSGGTLSPWIGSGPYPTLELAFRADEAGSASNTPVGGILAVPTVGFANVFTQSNTAALRASDDELDDALKERLRVATGPTSPGGPRAAITSLALDVHLDDANTPLLPGDVGYDAASATAISRVQIVEPGGAAVQVYLASAAGAAAGDDVTEGTDVWAANAVIQVFATAAGITVTVAPAVEVSVDYTATAYVDRAAHVTADEAALASGNAVAAYFETLRIGGLRTTAGSPQGYVFKEALDAAATVKSAGIFKVTSTVNGGSGDAALDAGEVATYQITLNTVLVTQG
jgi:hypothetical protein